MSTTFLLVAGCIIFAITTWATLWVGYVLMNRAWMNQNPNIIAEDDSVDPAPERGLEQRVVKAASLQQGEKDD